MVVVLFFFFFSFFLERDKLQTSWHLAAFYFIFFCQWSWISGQKAPHFLLFDKEVLGSGRPQFLHVTAARRQQTDVKLFKFGFSLSDPSHFLHLLSKMQI